MRQLWLFFEKNNIVFLFLLLELIGLYFFFSRSQYQKAKFLNSTSFIQANLSKQRNSVSSYLDLRKTNETLSDRNASLLQEIESLKLRTTQIIVDSMDIDSTYSPNYSLQTAEVITGRLHGANNLLTISKGENNGIEIGDGVLNANGAIGKIVETTPKYSLVMPLFNRNMRLNVQHKKSEYNGDLVWSGTSFAYVQVENIPRTADVEVGDTIITNQYSKSIPTGTKIGVVDQINYDIAGTFYRLILLK